MPRIVAVLSLATLAIVAAPRPARAICTLVSQDATGWRNYTACLQIEQINAQMEEAARRTQEDAARQQDPQGWAAYDNCRRTVAPQNWPMLCFPPQR